MGRFIAAFLVLIALGSCGYGQVSKTDSLPFTIDVSHSKYKLESITTPHFFNYTIGGQPILNDSLASYFTISDRPYEEHGFEVRKNTAEKVVNTYRYLPKITSLTEKEIIIATEKAFEICFTNNNSGKSVKEYIVVFGNNKTTLFFCGSASQNFDVAIKEFRKIVRTIKIK